MKDKKYDRITQSSVTNFLYCGDDFLFLKRDDNKRVDPGRLNGVGGRLEPGEDYLQAAIRETEEETGYKVTGDDIKLSGVVKLEGGYRVDWIMCFFKISVPTKDLPISTDTDDGRLIWLHKDDVLDSDFELVDDINYTFKDIVSEEYTFFATAQLDDNQIIQNINMSRLKNS